MRVTFADGDELLVAPDIFVIDIIIHCALPTDLAAWCARFTIGRLLRRKPKVSL